MKQLTEIEKIFSKGHAYNSHDFDYDLGFEVADMLLRARISRGVSQAKLAKLIKSKQPNIARIENGNYLPSLKTLNKIAKAFDSYLIAPKFAFLEDEDKREVKTTYTHSVEWLDEGENIPSPLEFQGYFSRTYSKSIQSVQQLTTA